MNKITFTIIFFHSLFCYSKNSFKIERKCDTLFRNVNFGRSLFAAAHVDNPFGIISESKKMNLYTKEEIAMPDRRAHTFSFSWAWPPYFATVSPIPKSKIKTDVFPIIALGFNYLNRSNFRFGVSFGKYDAFSSDTFYVSPLTNPYDKISITIYQLLLNADYIYVNRKRFSLYSGIALGHSLSISEGAHRSSVNGIKSQYVDYRYHRAWHLNLLGINYFPIKWVGLFAEVGYGYAGIIRSGIVFRSSLK